MKINLSLLVVMMIGLLVLSACTQVNVPSDDTPVKERPVKEFSMESFTVVKDGKYFPQYSLKEITVNRGDLVRIRINTTNFMHDFKIDELNVYSETPTGEVTVVEFVAGEAGEFVYYCTKPGHRQNGHWGTLKVLG